GHSRAPPRADRRRRHRALRRRLVSPHLQRARTRSRQPLDPLHAVARGVRGGTRDERRRTAGRARSRALGTFENDAVAAPAGAGQSVRRPAALGGAADVEPRAARFRVAWIPRITSTTARVERRYERTKYVQKFACKSR